MYLVLHNIISFLQKYKYNELHSLLNIKTIKKNWGYMKKVNNYAQIFPNLLK